MFNKGDVLVCTKAPESSKSYIGTGGEFLSEDDNFIRIMPDKESRTKAGFPEGVSAWSFTKGRFTLELDQVEPVLDEWL